MVCNTVEDHYVSIITSSRATKRRRYLVKRGRACTALASWPRGRVPSVSPHGDPTPSSQVSEHPDAIVPRQSTGINGDGRSPTPKGPRRPGRPRRRPGSPPARFVMRMEGPPYPPADTRESPDLGSLHPCVIGPHVPRCPRQGRRQVAAWAPGPWITVSEWRGGFSSDGT